DGKALGAIAPGAEAIDAAFHRRLDRDDGVFQHVALDEVVGKLVERPVEIVVDPDVAFERSDHDLPVAQMIAVERKTGALADDDAVGLVRRLELIGDLDGFVEDEMEDLEPLVEDEEETEARLVVPRTDEHLVRR